GAVAKLALHGDRATARLDRAPSERQAEARAMRLVDHLIPAHLRERFEDSLQVGFGNANSVVNDFDQKARTGPTDPHLNRRSVRTELDGVIQQSTPRFRDAMPVPEHTRQIRIEVAHDAITNLWRHTPYRRL